MFDSERPACTECGRFGTTLNGRCGHCLGFERPKVVVRLTGTGPELHLDWLPIRLEAS
jgi:hypothetical protein